MKTDNKDIKKGNTFIRLGAILTIFGFLSFGGQAKAQDDGSRSYWNARAGTNIFSFQYLPLNMGTSGSKAFAPGQYIYPNSDISANIFMGTWAHHMTFLNKPSTFAINIAGGNIGVNFNANVPSEVLPPGILPGTTFIQSSSGFADPSIAFVTNLIGTPPLKSNVDLFNYEPSFSMDLALLLVVPLGEYESDKLVNLGLNRWYGRFALPLKYHFGVFSPGYMSSFELTPSVYLFADNDDFVDGHKLENEPLWQIESHLTHDFTSKFFASLDMLYQNGFQSKTDGTEIADNLEIGSLGFSFNYQIEDNIMIRTSYSSNVFGNKELETSFIRLQFVYSWNKATENFKKLMQGG